MESSSSTDGPLFPPHTRNVIWTLFIFLLYSTAMFTLPFGAFFGTKHALGEWYKVTGFNNTVWSVAAAVVTMYAIILSYAYKGYCEKEYDEDGNEIDQSLPSSASDKKDLNKKQE